MGDDLDQRIYGAVMKIPRGRVATYAQIARVIGKPRHHRQVGTALGRLIDDGLVPWHRVIGANGRISRRGEGGECESIQRQRLAAEGIELDASGRVDLRRHQWSRARLAAGGTAVSRRRD